MLTVVNQNVPICPKCASGMHKSYTKLSVIYICLDHNHIWRVLDCHKNDNELVVSDNSYECDLYLRKEMEVE